MRKVIGIDLAYGSSKDLASHIDEEVERFVGEDLGGRYFAEISHISHCRTGSGWSALVVLSLRQKASPGPNSPVGAW